MPGVLCEHCTAVCCRYIALPIDPPEDPADFDDIRWFMLHEGASVFVEDGDWYLYIETACRHLQPDFRCGIYENRPKICRDYSTNDCDYHSGDYGWEHHFIAAEQLDDYMRTHHVAKRRRRVNGGRTRPGRPQVRVRLDRRPPQRGRGAASPPTDLRGVPLPVLRAVP